MTASIPHPGWIGQSSSSQDGVKADSGQVWQVQGRSGGMQGGSRTCRLVLKSRSVCRRPEAKVVGSGEVTSAPIGADVAQLVEQLIRNQQVSGSNPLVGSTNKPVSTGFFLFPATSWIQVLGPVQAIIQAMYDLAAAKDALAALENGDDPAAVRDALKALAVLTKSLKRRLKTPARRRKGEGALLFRKDKKLYQFEVELPRAPDGKRRRRVVYGKTAEETRRKVADLKARGGGSLRPVNPARISEYVTTWLEKSERRLAPKTFEHYVWAWDKAAPIIGGMRLDRFDRSGVISLFDALEDGGCSANTIRAVKTVMGSSSPMRSRTDCIRRSIRSRSSRRQCRSTRPRRGARSRLRSACGS